MTTISNGYSNHINHPDLYKKANQTKKAGRLFMVILIMAVWIGFPGYAIFKDESMETALLQAGFFTVALIGFNIWHYFKNVYQSKPWDGQITYLGLEKVKIYVPAKDDDDPGKYEWFDHYMMHIQCPNERKTRKVDFGVHGKGFNYYRQGERVKKHIGFPYPEKFNKIYDSHLICIGCGGVFVNTVDYCPDCGLILMK